ARVSAAVLPVQRRPEEEDAAHLERARRRAAEIGIADRPQSPRAVLRAVHAARVDREGLAVVFDLALPIAELIEARRDHRAAAAAHALEALEEARRARDPQ